MNSPPMRSIEACSRGYQAAQPFTTDRIDRVASRVSRSARNSPLRWPCCRTVLEDRLDSARHLADLAAAMGRQKLALGEEHLHEIAAVEQRRNMRPDQGRTGVRSRFPDRRRWPFRSRRSPRRRACRPVRAPLPWTGNNNTGWPAGFSERRRCPGWCAMIAALGKDLRRGLDDLARAPMGRPFASFRRLFRRAFAQRRIAAKRHAPGGACVRAAGRSRFHL